VFLQKDILVNTIKDNLIDKIKDIPINKKGVLPMSNTPFLFIGMNLLV